MIGTGVVKQRPGREILELERVKCSMLSAATHVAVTKRAATAVAAACMWSFGSKAREVGCYWE
jgi:hypothetical protein